MYEEEKRKFTDGTAKLEQGSKRLKETRRVAEETVSLGIDTLQVMDEQKDKMQGFRERVRIHFFKII
jgi:hypothetical protein